MESLKDSGARENTSLDYKEFDDDNLPLPREKLAPILAAFANSGGGRLVFGAKDKDERILAFQGASKKKSRAITASIRNAAHAVQPPVDVEVVDIDIPRTETLLFVVEVRAGQRGPFQYDGRYLQRVGDGVAPMPHVNVVNAVQAAAPSRVSGSGLGAFIDVAGGVRLDRPTLAGDASDKWRCGVLLSPTYETGRVLYDPFIPETKEIHELLGSRAYDVVLQTRQLRARHETGRQLEFWSLGHVKVTDSINTEGGVDLGDLSHAWSRFIADAAACLCLVDPMLIVDIEMWVWSFDRTPFTLRWHEGEDATEGLHVIGADGHHATPWVVHGGCREMVRGRCRAVPRAARRSESGRCSLRWTNAGQDKGTELTPAKRARSFRKV